MPRRRNGYDSDGRRWWRTPITSELFRPMPPAVEPPPAVLMEPEPVTPWQAERVYGLTVAIGPVRAEYGDIIFGGGPQLRFSNPNALARVANVPVYEATLKQALVVMATEYLNSTKKPEIIDLMNRIGRLLKEAGKYVGE